MSNLPQVARSQLAKFPEVTAFVVSDDAGSLIEASGDVDGEALGAIHVVLLQALERCGNALGLGVLDRISATGSNHACVLVGQDQEVLAVYIDPSKPLGPFEKKLETALKR